jgi:hypothetical protein
MAKILLDCLAGHGPIQLWLPPVSLTEFPISKKN